MPTLKFRDNSELTCAANCGRQHYYGYQEGLRPIVASIPLLAGTIAHSLARLIHQGKPWGPKLDGWYHEMMSYLQGAENGVYKVSWDKDKLDGRYQGLRYGLAAYADQYEREGWVLGHHEHRFQERLATTSTTMIGAIDGIIELSGELWIHELKTTTRKWTPRNLVFNRQFQVYTWAMRKVDPKIAGVAVRVVQLREPKVKFLKDGKPSTSASQHSCDRETLEAAIAKTEADLAKYADALAKMPAGEDYYLGSDLQVYTPEMTARFLDEELVPLCKDLDKAISNGRRIRNPGMFGLNCENCPYSEMCEAEWRGQDETAAAIRAEQFIVEPDRYVYLGGDED